MASTTQDKCKLGRICWPELCLVFALIRTPGRIDTLELHLPNRDSNRHPRASNRCRQTQAPPHTATGEPQGRHRRIRAWSEVELPPRLAGGRRCAWSELKLPRVWTQEARGEIEWQWEDEREARKENKGYKPKTSRSHMLGETRGFKVETVA
jgi:hypothetical protein